MHQEYNSKVRMYVSGVLRDWNTGEYNMAAGGDYSLAPAYYEWVAPERTGLRALVAVIEADEVDDPRLFGHGPELTVGLHIEVADELGNQVYEMTVHDLDGINTNGDMHHFFHESQTLGGGYAPGGAVPVQRIYTWELHDGPRGIELLAGWKLRTLVHDNFSTRCTNFHIHLFGNEVYERVFNPED